MDDFGAIERFSTYVETYSALKDAMRELERARRGLELHHAHNTSAVHAKTVESLYFLTDATLRSVRMSALEIAEQLARQLARDIIEEVRGSDVGPIHWLTGNSMVPPIREYERAEVVFQSDLEDAFEVFVDTLEREVDAGRVYMTSPEYDNALYAVDLTRWQHRDEGDEGDSLELEWEPITGAG